MGLCYGSQGVGTGGHLLGVILAKQTGTKLVHVPYRGVAPRSPTWSRAGST
jgi:tripartite-type tricarboxylate transporter receptor subunit TctC